VGPGAAPLAQPLAPSSDAARRLRQAARDALLLLLEAAIKIGIMPSRRPAGYRAIPGAARGALERGASLRLPRGAGAGR
jgi:hypothetical protein